MFRNKIKPFDKIYTVTLICMDAERGRKMAEIIKKVNPEHCLVKDLFYDSNLGEKDCPKILVEAIKEKPDVELLILNNINPDFRRYRDNEEFPGWLDDYAKENYIVDLMYLEDKYKDDLPLLYKKMECEAEYSRACIEIYITNGEDDEHEFIHKYSKESIVTSDCEEEDSDEDMEEDSDSSDDDEREMKLVGCELAVGLMNVIEQPKTKEDGGTEEVCTYQIAYLKDLCFPSFKPDPNKNYFVNFPALSHKGDL